MIIETVMNIIRYFTTGYLTLKTMLYLKEFFSGIWGLCSLDLVISNSYTNSKYLSIACAYFVPGFCF